MTDKTETAVNYTPEMEKVIRDASPLTLEKAKEVGEKIERSYRSVIAKAKQLGVEYIAKPAPAKKAKGPTKVERVGAIEKNTGLTLPGLEKASVAALTRLESWVIEQVESE